ncbi:preprotein translocase subunit SecY [Clostridium baratii]|uniref:Protein translocase subunit SecY n=1 Tax=Clostridium baratii TaxID=1561 RepID=A0A174URC0_9CLOT|nr:preprotein translocase subunit SecY [Clostridium baratii]OPF52222.1 preprotein translocase subunit SecY [Clostridium baratii]OPF55081.1 preprotein translocase subunit SecY [Clostridium baratii]OPF57180.1 preprotein translocase subunit SecY [Clostridium baratii]OPF60982.1 preprotein translocase subunit SecY [Clostridium baratii]CUQ24762.1 preprotein translocase subunit SecY [Clostridium baratii]
MLSTLRNAWKVPELRKRFYWTIFLVAIFRMGSHIPVPGISTDFLRQYTQSGNLMGFYDLISGGALSRFSIFALGVMPYINASIITQLLTIAIPSLEQLSKEGEEGRKKIQNATRYVSIVIAVILAFGMYATIAQTGATGSMKTAQMMVVILALVVGSTFCMWLGDQITVKGFGNGVSILIFVNIVSRLPMTIASVMSLDINVVEIALFLVFALAVLAGVIYFSLAERRIPVQYAGKAVGNKMMKGQSTHIPLSIVGSAVIAIIFSMSVMQFLPTIAGFFPDKEWAVWVTSSPASIFNSKTWMYPVVYALLTIFFNWFYTQVTFKPDEMSENLHKSAGFIPGIRPGEPTTQYFESILNRISFIGGIFAALLAVTPIIVTNYTSFKEIQFGGTALLIVVSVALDFTRKLESQMIMRHYKGFLK